METYTIRTHESGRFIGERTKTFRLPKRLRKVTKATVTIPVAGNKKFTVTVIGDNNAGNILKDNKQNKFGMLECLHFDGTNTTPDDMKMGSVPCNSDHKAFEFKPTAKQLRCGHKYGKNKC